MISRRPLSKDAAMVKAETLCARSEQCRHEVLTKLRQWGVGDADARSIVESLEERRFVDDSRFASAFVRDKAVFNRWGRAKIRQALMMKRVDRHLIDDAIAEIDANEYRAGLVEVMRVKARMTADSRSREGREKLLRHAVSRGFELSLAIDIIKRGEIWDD